VPLNIRARLNLEVGKFKANAKAAGASFKIIASSAKISTDKIDGYLKSSSDKRKAQIKRTEAQEIESARRKAKILSQIELEKYRNRGGIKPGTNVGRNLGLEEKKIARIAQMSAKQRAQYERQLAREFKALQKQKAADSKAFIKRNESDEKRYNKWLRSSNRQSTKEYVSFWKQALKEKSAAERKAKSETAAVQKWLANRNKAETKEYVNFWKAALKQREQAHKASLQKMKQDAQSNKIDYFNSKQFERQMAGARYALYDISRRAAMFGTALAGAFGLAAREAIKFQSAFTSVERTTQLSLQSNIPEVRGQAEELRKTLIQMSLEIPVAFEDITKAATLGAQLGIAADAVDSFSETVIKFSTITGISVDEVGMSFGRLAQLLDVPVSKFENLSSAITYTGINSVATDREILRMSESIGAAGYQAGLSADEVVGFSSALASLKVRPEEARGVFTRLFRTFDLEASLASERMDKFAAMMGRTTEEAVALYRTNPSDFFRQFLYGANATGELNVAMKELGIVNTRELNVITRLAGNMGVLEQALADSREQYLLGTYSTEAFGQVVDDVASRIQIMQNSIQALAAAVGEPLAGVAGIFADMVASAAQFLSNMGPVGKTVIAIFGGLLAGATLFFAALTGGIAGLLALKFAFKALAGEGIKANISVGTFIALAKSMTGASAGASAGVTGLAGSFKVLGLSIKTLPFVGLVATLATIAAVLIDAGIGASKSAEDFSKLGKAGVEAGGGLSAAMEAMARDAELGNAAINTLKITMSDEEKQARANKKAYIEMAEAHEARTESQKELPGAFDTTTGAIEDNTAALLDNQSAQAGVSGGVEIDEQLAVEQGEEYVKWLALGARKYAKEDGSTGDLLAEMLDFGVGTNVEASLRALGFDYMEMYTAAVEDAAGDGAGAQTYADAFDKEFTDAIDAVAFKSGATFSDRIAQAIDFKEITEEQGAAFTQMFDESGLSMQEFFKQVRVIPNAFDEAALAADAVNKEVENLATADAIERVRNSAAGLTEDVEDAEDAVIDLKDALTDLFGAQLAENKVADALDTLIQGAQNTAGEMAGLTKSARENFGNFASFIEAAVAAADAAGEGGLGTVDRIVDALTEMENAGLDAAEAFDVAKVFIVNALISINPKLEEFRAQLATAPDLAGMRAIINSFYAARIAAEGWSITLNNEWQTAIRALSENTSRFKVSLGSVSTESKKAQTALEKLQELIGKLFSWTNKRMALQESINSLGDSLEENGNTFSIWSKEGRSNVNSLLDVIDNMAVMSNGNLQVFANQLGAMRQALVRAGAPASALKLIDDALKKTGKTAKVSKKEVENFYRELADNDNAKKSLAEIASAVGNIQSALRASISAYFAQQNAIDDITLGWLDMADASDAARDSIEDAEKSIDDARRTIDEANASIQSLSAQSNTLEYQLQIALKYGDTLRADEIRGELAELNADIASEQDNIADANSAVAKSQQEIATAQGELGIGSTTRQIVEQNRALQDMATKYSDAAAWMLATAGEGEDLNEIIESQVTDFYNNALQMGYTETQASDLADVLRTELLASLEKIPEDVTTDINAETSEALGKVTQFAKDANARLATIKDKNITVTTTYKEVQVASSGAGGTGGSVIRRAAGGLVTGPGSATSDSIPALLSNGEYVVKASAVSRYGVDFLNSINQMRASTASRVTSSSAAGSSQTVYLSPEDRQLLRQAIDRPVALYTDNATIAQSANEGNRILAQRGIR